MSPEDYQACVSHRWRYKSSGNRSAKKYLARNRHAPWDNGGQARHNRTQENYFLHEFILDRMSKPKPSPAHVADHRDSDGDNCRRENLRWTTKLFNGINRNGRYAGVEFDAIAIAKMDRRRLLAAIKEIENARHPV